MAKNQRELKADNAPFYSENNNAVPLFCSSSGYYIIQLYKLKNPKIQHNLCSI